jgi:FkbM family methyltransferase
MPSFSGLSVSLIRSLRRAWPLSAGKDLPNHLGAYATKIGLLKPVWYEFQPGLWMRLDLRDMIQETILIERVWDPTLTEFINATLKPGHVFVDIGAHAGYFTLLAARRVGPEGRVLAFEPNPQLAAQARRNVERSKLTNVVLEEGACSDTTETATLYLFDVSNSGRGSLSGANAGAGGAVQVPCTPLDLVVERRHLTQVNLIKIDVEGAELKVLRGMTETIRRTRPIILIELEPRLLQGFSATVSDVTQLLESFGYTITPFGGHANYMCTPTATISEV